MPFLEHPVPSIVPGIHGQDLLRRVMGVRVDHDLIDQMMLLDRPGMKIALRDTGAQGIPPTTADRNVAIHFLWARNDAAAHVQVNGHQIPVAPGDTMTLVAGVCWLASAGMLICEIAGPDESASAPCESTRVPGPSHGVETFHGHNRQTTYQSPAGLEIERWKITQPLTLAAFGQPYVIVDLVEPLALVWRGGTDIIHRGDCRIVPPGTGSVTLIPDGLGYALIVRQGPEQGHRRPTPT